MLHLLKRLVSAPVFPDKELTRAARWLTFLSLILITLLAADSIAILIGLLDEQSPVPILTANTLALLTNLSVLLLTRRGYVRAAAIILLAIFFALITYSNAVIFQSIRTPNVMAYLVLIPFAGLLLGRRPMNILATVCVIMIGLVFYLEWQGVLISPPEVRSLFDDGVVIFFAIALNTVLLNASIRRVEEKAEEIRQSAAALAIANQNLQASQADLQQVRGELEERVKQRTEELKTANTQLTQQIRERQQVLDALRASEANWRSLATNLPEIIATLSPDGVITFINRTTDGRAPESLIGAHASSLHRWPKTQELLQQSMTHVWQSGETVSYESEETTAESTTWYINRVGAIKQDGEVTALILISTDITEQKQAEAAMHQSQKLESLGVLAGGVAHDFNNLLTAMLMQMSFALVKLPPDHPVSHHINRTLKAAERAAELTRQMLNYTGRSPSEARPMDLNDLITDNIHLFSAAIPKSVQLDPQLSGSIPLMVGDKGQIQQLIMNLILNAADAIGQRAGTITVETTAQEIAGDESEYWQWTGIPLTSGRYVRLDVKDTGSGMDAKTLSRIFDPFFTTKFTGRGLGLASVLGIIRSHKGGLHVSSILRKGTTFTILFPAAGEVTQLFDSDSDTLPTALDGELVLIIDDEEMVRDAMGDILAEAGLQAIKAANGLAGIQLFRKHEQELQLVLLDLSMPGMSGEEVFHALQAINPQIPILLVSGYSEHEVMERFVNTGLTGFIQKPYTIESLLQQIQPHLKNSRTINMAR